MSRRCVPTFSRRSATSARSLGDNESAISAYRHALQLDHDFAVVRFQLARLLQLKGQNREAEQELVAALDAVPTYAEATLELATLRRRLGRPSDALALLVELLQRDPYHLDALLALGETLLALGRKRDAVHAFVARAALRSVERGRAVPRGRDLRRSNAATATRSIDGSA